MFCKLKRAIFKLSRMELSTLFRGWENVWQYLSHTSWKPRSLEWQSQSNLLCVRLVLPLFSDTLSAKNLSKKALVIQCFPNFQLGSPAFPGQESSKHERAVSALSSSIRNWLLAGNKFIKIYFHNFKGFLKHIKYSFMVFFFLFWWLAIFGRVLWHFQNS